MWVIRFIKGRLLDYLEIQGTRVVHICTLTLYRFCLSIFHVLNILRRMEHKPLKLDYLEARIVPSYSRIMAFYVPETAHMPPFVICIFYIPITTATWIRVPSIPASFSAPIPLKEDQLILKLMDAADSRVTGLRPSSVAVLIDRSASDMPFQDVCETAAQEASGSAGAIIVANMNPGPELFQMVSTSKDFSMDLACLLISHESGLHLRSSMTMKEVWISISLEPTSTIRSSADPDVWKPLRPQTQSIIFDNKPPEYCCHCPLL